MNRMHEIIEKYGEEYVLRQLAEECSELAQAALKMIRVWHGETPMRWEEAREHLIEEIADVHFIAQAVCNYILTEKELQCVDDICKAKEERMYRRMLDGEMEDYKW